VKVAEQFVHALALLAPVRFEYVPAGHCTHVLALLAPVAFEYVPAGHAVQLLKDK
jgi:hypothetical protein